MPAKISQLGGRKQDFSAKDKFNENASAVPNVKKVCIWPEWSEAAILAEKWELGITGGGKGKDKKDKFAVSHYEDPDKVLFPSSFVDPSVVIWKRPNDPLISDVLDKSTPVIVSDPESTTLDLRSSNTHLFHSQFMCWIIGQLKVLWQMRHHNIALDVEGILEGEKDSLPWCPWEHIQPHPKGMPSPQINPAGKYYIRIYWMGCWRKVTVDDKLPFLERSSISSTYDQDDQAQENKDRVDKEQEKRETLFIPLFPMTSNLAEMWPVLIFKAILKVAALDYCGGDTNNDYGDSSVIHMLTGWTHHTVQFNSDHMWDLLTDHLPMWIRDWDTPKKYQHANEVKKHVARKDCILMASFHSCYPCYENKSLPISTHRQVRKTEAFLKRFSIIPQAYNLSIQPSVPVLMTQVRDQPLVPSPPEPPLPILQTPYYLGLTHRQPHPGYPTPPPTPPIIEPRFVELFPSVLVHEVHSLLTYCSKSTNVSGNTTTSITKGLLTKPYKASVSRKSILKIPSISSGSGEQSETCKGDGKKWMNYLEFCSAFNDIHIFKDPCQFKYKDTYFDLSKTLESPVISGSLKKSIPIHHVAKVLVQPPTEHNFLFVDSVDPVELLFVFSSLSNWREGDKDTNLCTPSKQISSCSPTTSPEETQQYPASEQKFTVDHISDGAVSESSLVESEVQKKKKHILPGHLVLQTYFWRTVQFGDPVLQISTTGTKGAKLILPPGRHVFKLHAEAPIGHHLEIFSHTQFTLADKETMFGCLSQDCCRFVSYSSHIIEHLLTSSAHCGDLEALKESLEPLARLCCEASLLSNHAKFLLASALHSWSTLVSGYDGLTGKMQGSWKAFLQKVFQILEKMLPQGFSPAIRKVSELRKKLKMCCSENGKLAQVAIPETWVDRKPVAKEIDAAKVISHFIQQRSKAYLKSTMVPGTEANERAAQLLKESLPILESMKEKLGVMLFHGVIKLDPCIADKLPFAGDLSTVAYSSMYTGMLPSIQTNSWTIILRKTLQISEAQFMAFHFSCSLQSTLLRVIDNDTMVEMPRVFQNTTPCIYTPNHKGYTLQAEAWVQGMTTATEGDDKKKWKLLVITSNKERPPVMKGWNTEEGKETETEEIFNRQEIMDYCLPNREDVLFRYSISPSEECKVSIQVTISKQDALLKLEILNHEDVVTAVEGRGTCTIPLCSLQPSPLQSTDVKEVSQENTKESCKYFVQGSILIKSWPIADTAWPHLSFIRTTDRLEESTTSSTKPSSGKKKKVKQPFTPAPIVTIDTSKPHWVMQIVHKDSESLLTVKKDTEKEDKLKSMVEAWEMQEPGRTHKAQTSRQKFLEAHITHEEGKEDIQSLIGVLTQKLKPNTGPINIQQMDLTPFILKSDEDQPPKLLDEAERAHRLEERQTLFKEYRVARKAMLQLRNRDREQRNEAKLKQLGTAEEWQVALDFRRHRMNYVRESLMEKYQAMEKARVEKEVELTGTNVVEVQSPSGGRESKTKGGKKKK